MKEPTIEMLAIIFVKTILVIAFLSLPLLYFIKSDLGKIVFGL